MKIGLAAETDAFLGDHHSMVGRQVANEALVRALLRCDGTTELGVFNSSLVEHLDLKVQHPTVRWHLVENLVGLLRWAEVILVLSPMLSAVGEMRRTLGILPSNCRIIGITHALHTLRVKRELGGYHVGLCSSDALICTSRAAFQAAINLSTNTVYAPQVLFLPLGIDVSEQLSAEERFRLRPSSRVELGVEPDDFCLLYFGRIDYTSKAHFVSMFRFAEAIAAHLKREVILALLGWFPSRLMATHFIEAGRLLAPSVTTRFIDGRIRNSKFAALAAADACVLPSDNIQESFGIAPLEAMLAGIPCAVAEWDGYRDTVLPSASEVLLSTVYPWEPVAFELHRLHDAGTIDDVRLAASMAALTAIDHVSGAKTFAALMSDAVAVRESSRRASARVADEFAWSKLGFKYLEVFQELGSSLSLSTSHSILRGRADNPFAHFATRELDGTSILMLEEDEVQRIGNAALTSDSLRVLPKEIFSLDILNEVFDSFRVKKLIAFKDLVSGSSTEVNIMTASAISVLLKWGLLRHIAH